MEAVLEYLKNNVLIMALVVFAVMGLIATYRVTREGARKSEQEKTPGVVPFKQFHTGSSVCLKGEGPIMTVGQPHLHQSGKWGYECQWFQNGELRSGRFLEDSLRSAKCSETPKLCVGPRQ